MPRFIKFQIDWAIHAKLNNDILEQSTHGKDETPEGCTCDICYERFCIASVDSEDAAECLPYFPVSKILEASQLCDSDSKEIEGIWEFPDVDNCKCYCHRCHIHQFKLFCKEHKELVKEHSKLMVDWFLTLKSSQQLQDLQTPRERHHQFRKRLSDAGFRHRSQRCEKVDFSSLKPSEGWY
ncbi:hypothetical protein ACHAPC_002163 [Botrytis cinerea]